MSATSIQRNPLHLANLLVWLLPMLLLLLLAVPPQPCESRYLPTRSQGNDLDKLRELMMQILELSNEDTQQQQQQHPPLHMRNEGNNNNNNINGNPLTGQARSASAAWLQKFGPLDEGNAYGRY